MLFREQVLKSYYPIKVYQNKYYSACGTKITAFDSTRKNDLIGKAKFSNATTTAVFELLNTCGIKTHYVKKHDDESFIGIGCDMIPLEVVTRRIATWLVFEEVTLESRKGTDLHLLNWRCSSKMMPSMIRFWTYEQCVENELIVGGKKIGKHELNIMGEMAVAVFEILERAWATVDVALVDMKVEFGFSNKDWRTSPC
ncbi:hypothetical protein OS493_032016 [Desmophyllum pertusum]|uniref:phosphoribosylaminoimidazolesuccinocarboxamide synthase n=1 Tax=Desmophyllum pertusum TaxID=174260 RepID=A0A9W9Z8B0_9CNID|nr:hypothetical protein OS493_032016 [Desmophyllum pertusum]